MNVPANNTGKSFLTKVADTLEWAASNGEEEHYAWYANSVLTAAFLQSKDKKANLKQRTTFLKARLQLIESGRLEEVI